MKQLPCILVGVSALALAQTAPSQTNTPVDLELSLVIDISGSVSTSEYNAQIGGYSAAFQNPQIIQAIENIGQLAVNAVFFDSTASQALPFSLVDDSASSNAFASDLASLLRPRSGGTSPNTGIDLATSLLNSNSYDGTRVVIDVSGDGTGSSTLDSAARDNALAAGVTTINGIAIGSSRTDPNVPTSLEQYYLDNIAGGNGSFVVLSEGFDDFEDAILTKLLAEITGTNPIASGLTPILPAIRNTELLSVAAAYGDINARLMRMRAGIRSQPTTTTSASPVAPASAKGGLSGKGGKGGLAKDALIPEASVTTYTRPWEVYGTIGYTSASYDAQTALTQGASVATAIPGYDVDLLHGTVGVEYDLDENFSVGAAIVASTGDIDLDDGSEVDTDRFGFAIYGSFFRNVSALGVPAAFHADLLYGYSQASYDSDRVTGGGIASGDTDGDSHVIQLHTGLSFENNNFTHGPIAGLFYQTGTIDGYSETGPGALSYSDVDVDSLRSQLGYQASYEISTQVGKVVPQVRAAWEHEFEDDEIIVSGLSLGEPASDIAVLGAAVYWQFHSSAYAVLDYEARLADNFDSHTIWLRIGAEF